MTQSPHRVLIVEDEPDIRGILSTLLQTANYRVVEAENAARAEAEARGHKPDLLIVDLGLPDADGLAVIRRVREWSPVPILVLSARTMEEQKVAALDAGADDYVTKPFSAPELLARVRAALRRNARGAEQSSLIELGELTIDLGQRTARTKQGEVRFTPMEYRLIESLARQAGMIVTQRQLVREVWGPDREADMRSLRVFVKHIREKIEPNPSQPRYLVTEAGVGYRLVVPQAEGRDEP